MNELQNLKDQLAVAEANYSKFLQENKGVRLGDLNARERNMYMHKSHQARSAVSSIKKKLCKIELNYKGIVKILKSQNIPTAKSSTTAIRGHKNYQMGYKISTEEDEIRIYWVSQGYTACGTYQQIPHTKRMDVFNKLCNEAFNASLQTEDCSIVITK